MPRPEPHLPDRIAAAAAAVDKATHLLREAMQIADRAVIADIECDGVSEQLDGRRWYDTRPMLDPREQPADNVEMARQAIDYALGRGLAVRHPDHPHLLRII